MCFAIVFIGAEPECRESILLKKSLLLVVRTEAKGRGLRVWRRALWLIALQAGTARLKKKGQWPTVQSQVSGAPASPRSVGIDRPYDLVVGLERSYKSLEEIWEGHASHMKEKHNSSWPSLPSNKLVERTLPRCALQRRSPARYASHDLPQSTCGYHQEIS